MPNNLVLPSGGSKSSSRSSSKAMRSRLSPTLSHTPAMITLTFGKASRVFAAFVSFHYLQDRVALPLYLFFVTLGATAALLALQRPWNGKRIGAKRGRRCLLAGGLLVASLYLWTAGLRSAGPLRTLLVDGAELPLLYLFALITRRELPERRKTRGALCMLVAYCLLIWDASGHVPDVREIEHSKLGQRAEHMVGRLTHRGAMGWAGQNPPDNVGELAAGFGLEEDEMGRNAAAGGAGGGPNNNQNNMQGGGGNSNNGVGEHNLVVRRRRRLLTTFRPRVKGPGGVKDAFVEGTALRCEIGVILVLLASVIVQAGRGFSRRLATELGGAKRHFALAVTSSVAWVTPLALLSWASSATGSVLSLQMIGGVTRIAVTPSHALGFFSVGFIWLVLPFYARAIVSTTISSRVMMQSAVVVPFVMAAIVCSVFGGAASAGGLSWVLLIAFFLECIGVSLMMEGGVKRGLSELPIDAAHGSNIKVPPATDMQTDGVSSVTTAATTTATNTATTTTTTTAGRSGINGSGAVAAGGSSTTIQANGVLTANGDRHVMANGVENKDDGR